MTNNEYREPTLRQMLDESKGAVASPGRYCDRMAYIIDCFADAQGDEEVSEGFGGDYHSRFGRRILTIDTAGFVECERYDTVAKAEEEMRRLRRRFGHYAG
jgi:hypothetical protein